MNFAPDIVSFGDLPGYGAWDTGHHREHLQFIQVLAQRTPAVLHPDRDLLSFLTAGEARKSQGQAHQAAHELLRDVTGVTGIDLGEIDFDNRDAFYSWLGYHRNEHAQIRQILGIV